MSPLVSVGIPTHDRAEQLERAIASVLGQTHAEMEVVIGDNASTDRTPEVCARAEASDPRVRTIRRGTNIGPIANFNALFAQLRGEYAMLLADDDWLEPGFLHSCLQTFSAQPDLAVVHGRTHYVGEAGETFGHDFDVSDPDGGRRVCQYLTRVYDNGAFYGLIRGDAMRAALPIPNMLGADWTWLARLVFQGGLRVREDTTLVRSHGELSTSFERVAEASGLPTDVATHAITRIIAGVHRDIVSGSPVYAALGTRARRVLAARAVAGLLRARGGQLMVVELRPLLARPLPARAVTAFRRTRPYRPPRRCRVNMSRRSGSR